MIIILELNKIYIYCIPTELNQGLVKRKQWFVLKLLSESEWKAEVVKKHQEIQDEHNAKKQPNKTDQSSHRFVQGQENVVKVVDKFYLEKKFHSSEFHFQMKDSIAKYPLNEEQESTFHIVANHAETLAQNSSKCILEE
jgi:N-acetylmuramoyl-L-alanine amidase CwlA